MAIIHIYKSDDYINLAYRYTWANMVKLFLCLKIIIFVYNVSYIPYYLYTESSKTTIHMFSLILFSKFLPLDLLNKTTSFQKLAWFSFKADIQGHISKCVVYRDCTYAVVFHWLLFLKNRKK